MPHQSKPITLPVYYARRSTNASGSTAVQTPTVQAVLDENGLFSDSDLTNRVGTAIRRFSHTITPGGVLTIVNITHALQSAGTISFSVAHASATLDDPQYSTGTGSQNFAFYTPLVYVVPFNNFANEVHVTLYPLIKTMNHEDSDSEDSDSEDEHEHSDSE